MKQLGCGLLVLLVAVGGFFALTVLVFTNTDDQRALTEEVAVVVRRADESSRPHTGRGWGISYAYRVQGQWYGEEDWIADDYWTPQDPLAACVDPDDPARHVLRIRASERCGQESVRPSITTATPASTPDGES